MTTTIGIFGIVLAVALIFIKTPIGVALGAASLIGIVLLTDIPITLSIIATTPFDYLGNWALSAVPMFLFMGYICTEMNLTRGLFEAMRVLLCRLPGGLAVASVGGCALFAAASGSSVATSAAMARIAVPEMIRYNYDKGLAAGTIAASGTLGSLIPPSILMILYGVYVNVSIGKLFIAGVIPGLLTAMAFALMIVGRAVITPRITGGRYDRSQTVDPKERWRVLGEAWELPVIILCVLGGIFLGIFTPTESAAIGSALCLALAVIKKRFTFNALRKTISASISGTLSIFMILIGAAFFAKFLALSKIPDSFASLILSVNHETWWILCAIALLYLFLGMLIDSISLLYISLPLVYPLIMDAGFDLIWFGIIAVKLLELGMITPPVGLNVYVVKGSLGNDVTLEQVFRGITWFLVTDLIILAVLVLFPKISLMLPSLM